VVTGPQAGGRSRRQLLGGAGAAALALAGCGATHNHVKTTVPVASEDLVHLGALLDLEHKTVAAYEAGIPLLDAVSAKAASLFLGHELSHVGELSGLIKKAGGKPAHAGLYDLGHPRTSDEVLTLLHELEAAQLAAYLAAIPKLTAGPTRAALAAVCANDAQHLAVVRQRLGLSPAPQAFVTGRE
jgi:ferritin-like protein